MFTKIKVVVGMNYKEYVGFLLTTYLTNTEKIKLGRIAACTVETSNVLRNVAKELEIPLFKGTYTKRFLEYVFSSDVDTLLFSVPIKSLIFKPVEYPIKDFYKFKMKISSNLGGAIYQWKKFTKLLFVREHNGAEFYLRHMPGVVFFPKNPVFFLLPADKHEVFSNKFSLPLEKSIMKYTLQLSDIYGEMYFERYGRKLVELINAYRRGDYLYLEGNWVIDREIPKHIFDSSEEKINGDTDGKGK